MDTAKQIAVCSGLTFGLAAGLFLLFTEKHELAKLADDCEKLERLVDKGHTQAM